MKSTKESRAKAAEKAEEKHRHELKVKIRKEIDKLLKELENQTLDGKKLKSGLSKARMFLKSIPNHDI